ncbi:hypothetical protein E3_2030 [Rhodococcus phage E3]|uniref:hypothetical protein n=1 Tax=Rhodococcus phage E3 TaxID=1007869 RepID=UPI0002C6A250|nr:hypothetical protein M176_gp215 [Rhodococcus phage E3]AEQ21123.1 hypothetical protein E3_2030 [Rhodococcus phage E3]
MSFDFTHSTDKALEMTRQVMLQSDSNYTGSEYQIALDAEIERRRVASWEGQRPNRVIEMILTTYARKVSRRAEVDASVVDRMADDLLGLLESEGYGDLASFEVPIPVVGRPRVDFPVGEAVKIFEEASTRTASRSQVAVGVLAVLSEVAARQALKQAARV